MNINEFHKVLLYILSVFFFIIFEIILGYYFFFVEL